MAAGVSAILIALMMGKGTLVAKTSVSRRGIHARETIAHKAIRSQHRKAAFVMLTVSQPARRAGLCFGVVIASIVTVASGHNVAVSEVADWLQLQEQQLVAVETECTVTAYWARPVSEVKASTPPEWRERVRGRWLNRGCLWRLERTSVPFAHATETVAPQITDIWNGQEWLQQFPDANRYDLSSSPTFNPWYECFLFFNTLNLPFTRGPLSEFVRSSPLVGVTVEGSKQHFRFEPAATTLFEIVVETAPTTRLDSVTLTALERRRDGTIAPTEIGRIVYWVEQWEVYGGISLPRIAYRDAYANVFGPQVYDQPQLTRIVFERHSATDRSADLPSWDNFLPDYEAGWSVNDTRLNLQYQVGFREIRIDGMEYRTDVSVDPEVVRRLSQLATGVQESENETIEPPGARSFAAARVYRALVVGSFVFAGSLMIVMLLRFSVPRIRRTMTRRVLVLPAIALALVAVVLTVQLLPKEGKMALSGESFHDFGEVTFSGHKVALSHTFTLVNTTTEPVEIVDTKPSCGCTVSRTSSNVVNPGEQVGISVTLSLLEGAPRTEHIWLVLRDRGTQTLTVAARGRLPRAFYAAQKAVDLRRTSETDVTLVAIISDSDEIPASPGIESPNGVTAKFEGWQLVYPRNVTLGRSARWQALVRITRIVEVVPDRARLVVSAENKRIDVDLTSWPWS